MESLEPIRATPKDILVDPDTYGENSKRNDPHRLDNSSIELPTVSTSRRRRFVDFLKPEKQRVFKTIKLAHPD